MRHSVCRLRYRRHAGHDRAPAQRLLGAAYESDDLAVGIAWVVEDLERWRKLSEHARRKVEREFTIMLQAQRYRALYEELLEARQKVSPP